MQEIINIYADKRDQVVKTLTEKFDTFYDGKEDDLKEIAGFIDYSNRLVQHLVELINNYQSIDLAVNTKNKSIDKLLERHSIMTPFNKENADKTLVNGLIKILIQGNTFDGTVFKDKSGVKKHYSKIIKRANPDENVISNYKKLRQDVGYTK